jgi:Ala-tRNA(Pro) deacylase
MSARLNTVETPDPFASRFAALGIGSTTFEHDAFFTVEQGREVKHLMPGGHTKNLFLKDKKGVFWLVTALWDTDIDLKKLPARINAARLSFGNAEWLQQLLGVTPGSVTPLGLVNDSDKKVTPVLDAAMMDCDVINCHPLRNDRTTALKPHDLVKFLKSLGYNPLIVDFSRI